jgi:hypothetical protein
MAESHWTRHGSYQEFQHHEADDHGNDDDRGDRDILASTNASIHFYRSSGQLTCFWAREKWGSVCAPVVSPVSSSPAPGISTLE